jgi:nucleoside-diphosphate-sugar epimerase
LREENLILQQLSSNPSALFIYFSTCSIFDNSLSNTPYVHHKKRMEQLISDKFSNYLIMRLPTVIGQTSNMNTFFNNIRIRLKSSLDIHVFQKATRYLLAIDDLPTITKLLLENNVANRVINIAFNNKASVPEIVLFMKETVGANSNLIFVDKGSDLIISNDDFLKIVALKKNEF